MLRVFLTTRKSSIGHHELLPTQIASRLVLEKRSVSAPPQPRDDGLAHDQVLVGFGEKTQLLREMRHALAVASLGIGVCYIGAPIAALRAVGIEQTTDMGGHVAERIGLRRH